MSTAGSTGGAPQSTGGGGGGSTGIASTAGAIMGWGDDWRTRLAAGSTDIEKEVTQLQRYESPEQIWRKAREMEQRISRGELRSQLPKDAAPEVVTRWRQENGIPVKPEDYKINMPKGKDGKPMEAAPADDPFLQAFLKDAHAQNYSQPQVDSAIASFYKFVDQQVTANNAEEDKLIKTTDNKLHETWGRDYATNMAMVENLLSRAPAGFADRFRNGKLADGTPLRASLEAYQWLVQMEREINPAGTVVPGAQGDGTKAIADEKADLMRMSTAPAGSADHKKYWKEGGRERYRALVEAEQRIATKSGSGKAA